jgi:hypothetical protein
MAENKNGFEDVLTNLAMVTEGIQAIFPRSKSVLLYEVSQNDFNMIRSNFKTLKYDENQIKIDMSGTEIVFILEGSYEPNIQIKEEPKIDTEINKKKKNKIWRFFNFGKK